MVLRLWDERWVFLPSWRFIFILHFHCPTYSLPICTLEQKGAYVTAASIVLNIYYLFYAV